MISKEVHPSLAHLMVPRAQLIAPYPNMQDSGKCYIKVGDVFCYDKNDDLWDLEIKNEETDKRYSESLKQKWCNRFPANFKILNWFGVREEHELPKYQKVIDRGGERIRVSKFRDSFMMTEDYVLLPATEEEYLEYTKENEK